MGKPGPRPGSAARAASQRAAATLRARYGADYYSRIGKRTGALLKQANPDHLSAIRERAGIIGGNVTLARYGQEHYAALGRMSAEMRKESVR